MDNGSKYIVIDYLYSYNLKLVKEYSESICNSLDIGWQNYVASKDKKNSKKYKEKLEKNLEKLSKKEKEDNSFVYGTLECIDNLQKQGMLNSKFKNSLTSNIKELNLLSSYFKFLINKYDEIKELEARKEKYNQNVNKVDMPYKIDCKEYSVKDNNGYYYYHVKIVKGNMVVVNSSLKAEKQLYKNALKDNKNKFKEVNKNVKLSPFEKKRRIYIENVYEMDKLIKMLYEKEINITYPLEKNYMYSKRIVDELYQELNKSFEKKDIFDYIMNATIENINFDEVCSNYGRCVKRFNQEMKKLDNIVKEEFINDSNRIKKISKYADFKRIDGVVPSIYDIYNVVNNRIIDNLGKNYKDSIDKMNDYIVLSTKYMNEKELVNYYMEYKNVLLFNKCNIELIINLQRNIVDILINKFHIDDNIIFNELLKEEKIF